MFYEDETIYSHGRHWPIARFVKNKRGQTAVVVNVQSRSVSTRQHTGHVLDALRGLGVPVFEVHSDISSHVPPGEEKVLSDARHMLKLAGLANATAARARKDWNRDHYAAQSLDLFERARAYARFFGCSSKLRLGADARAELDKLALREKAIRKSELKRAKAREAEARRRDAEDFASWRAGTLNQCPSSYMEDSHGSAYLRVSLDGSVVKTSRGAEVPRDHAERAVRFVLAVRANGSPWVRNGHTLHVGVFQVDRIEATGAVRAGCHFFTFERVAELAKALGIEVTS
jgi:hypothetical protein